MKITKCTISDHYLVWNLGERWLSEFESEAAQRFTEVFAFAYDRFLDLQAKERRARQAQVEAGLEGVRAEVTAMQQSTDLLKIVQRISQALRELGVPLQTLGFNLFDGEAGIWTSYFEHTPEKAAQIDLSQALEFEIINTLYTHWEAGQTWYRWTSIEEFEPLLQFFLQMGYITHEVFHRTMDMARQKGSWILDIPFNQGTLALISPAPLDGEQIALVERFTQSFALGYARYLDFQRLETQNQALKAANEQIQEATHRKSDFLARMSHDLRTPMNAIIGYTRILLHQAKNILNERQYRNLDNIQISANNLLSLINDILDLAKIEAGRIDIKPEEVDLKQLATECIASVASLVKPGVQLEQQLEDVNPTHTDADRIRRVVMNLLSNALKFTEKGRITVSLKPVDDGVGLSMASLPHPRLAHPITHNLPY